jgi:hypothetical protein
VTQGRTLAVGSMLLIFSYMKFYFNVYCMENMSWPCLTCKCKKHALCLSTFAALSFSSFFDWSCWFVAHSWIRSLSRRPLNEDHVNTLLASSYKFGWRPGLYFGVPLWVQFWTQIKTPKYKFVRRRKQGRVDMIFIQWSATYSNVHNKPTNSVKEGGET